MCTLKTGLSPPSSDDDIAYIYDIIREKLDVEPAKHSVITIETAKLKKRYLEFCEENGSE